MAQAPVRRNQPFTGDNRHGALQDVNQDNQVSFADTFLGDLLGMDGQGGVQGPGMRDSMSGARRQQAIAMLQERGAPMTEQNVQRAMQMTDMGPGGGAENMRPQMRPDGVGPAAAPVDPATLTNDEMIFDGMPEEVVADPDAPIAGNGAIAGTAATTAAIAALVMRAARNNGRNRSAEVDSANARSELTAMGLGLNGEPIEPTVPVERGPRGRPIPVDDVATAPPPVANLADPASAPIDTEQVLPAQNAQTAQTARLGQSMAALPEGSQMLDPSPELGNLPVGVAPDGTTYVQGGGGMWMAIDPNAGSQLRQNVIRAARSALF